MPIYPDLKDPKLFSQASHPSRWSVWAPRKGDTELELPPEGRKKKPHTASSIKILFVNVSRKSQQSLYLLNKHSCTSTHVFVISKLDIRVIPNNGITHLVEFVNRGREWTLPESWVWHQSVYHQRIIGLIIGSLGSCVLM